MDAEFGWGLSVALCEVGGSDIGGALWIPRNVVV